MVQYVYFLPSRLIVKYWSVKIALDADFAYFILENVLYKNKLCPKFNEIICQAKYFETEYLVEDFRAKIWLSKYLTRPQTKRIKNKTIKCNKKLYLQIVDFTKNILSFFLWRQSFCATGNRLHKGRFFCPKCNWLLNKLSYLYTISTDWVADTRLCMNI